MTEIYPLTWLGAILLALCGVPQAFKASRDPRSTLALSWVFLGAWWLGELAMLSGFWCLVSWHALANYTFNLALVSYLIRVKWSVR